MSSGTPHELKLSLCMIVRNEERYLDGCLRSAEGVVDEIVVVDTGSTDGTLAIAERHGARIVHFPWSDDFSAARNVSLRQASGDWILVLDADERLGEASRQQLRSLLSAPDVAGYSLICENLVGEGAGDQSQHAPVFRLFRNRPDIYFEGMIHEQAILSAKRTGLMTCASEVRILHLGYTASEVTRRDKRQRNRLLLERQVAAEPTNAFARFNLGEVLKLQDLYEAAEKQYRAALDLLKREESYPKISYVANLYFSLGDLYREMRRFQDAHALLDEAIALYPTFADLYYTKGFAFFDAGRFPEAIEQFEHCPRFAGIIHPFAMDPGVSGHKAMRALADSYIRLGDRARAKHFLEQALAVHPNPDAALFANLGILLLDEGQDQQARQHFERAVALDPGESRSWLNLLMLALQSEDYHAIVATWNRRPEDAASQALMLLAFALLDRPWPVERADEGTLVGVWCDAVELALVRDRTGMVQALLDRLDEWGAALPTLEFALGRVFLRQQHPELALGSFMRAQQRHPEDPHVYLALAEASLAAGHHEEARAMYARAQELQAPPERPQSL